MAFNPNYQTGQRGSIRRQVATLNSEGSLDANSAYERENSILSDSEASSWVLFNPTEGSDILSLSNGTVEESDEESESGNEIDPEDSLIDDFAPLPSQSRLERLFTHQKQPQSSRLDQRIDQWRNDHCESELVDDNTASWDLDENLQSELRSETTSTHTITPDEPPNTRPFYGDDLVRNMSRRQFRKVKRTAGRLAPNLTREQQQGRLPQLLDQLISRLLRSPEFGLEFNLQNHSYQSLIETMLEHPPRPRVGPATVEYSDTASSSSMVLCGGSWGDI
ncbi:hypothetical protein PGUG_01575 [Meyerozyma guilliermondii ATCC 6260]|uniref:Uncharacterized protein n=1 Tax=Meyerozyma guilliermondii (strain ATCC 6260 / CBS 566 / DSM 6381 / JCM 1539 / NBRC 10279 / NRRL Y-324) TaxID=294746 RepID=A5DE74_PICGU|nr:uncharacterized protein PGUG_01575 [Meyerozyma guilliermondii ATCC 6260]EDK37477.2 hypothetical protein PGUG_01575 [Meyerozyma guilliermondii ATCC 6260]